MKKILNKQIEKKKLCRIQNRYEQKNENSFQKKNASKKPEHNVKIKNVSKIKKKKIVIITKFNAPPLQKIFENIDSVVSFKVRKFRIFFRSKLTNFWKFAENNDDLMKEIKNAEIIVILKNWSRMFLPRINYSQKDCLKNKLLNCRFEIWKSTWKFFFFLIFMREFSCLSNFKKSNSNQNVVEFKNWNQFYERGISDDSEIDYVCPFSQNFDQFSDRAYVKLA